MKNFSHKTFSPKNIIQCCSLPIDPRKMDALLLYLSKNVHQISTPLYFDSGQFLFYAGHTPYGLFLIESGRIELQFNAKQPCKTLGAPIILGFDHLLNHSPYCGSCVARSPLQTIFIAKTSLKDVI